MSKVLAYCCYLNRAGISFPASGVEGAPLHDLAQDNLHVMYSAVEWPFAAQSMQQHAVEFHHVVEHFFQQIAVAPFGLLTVFESPESLAGFVAQNREALIADLVRLSDCVQMECVVYSVAPHRESPLVPDRERAVLGEGALRQVAEHVQKLHGALETISREVRVRNVSSGSRVFALLDRGKEGRFHQVLDRLQVAPPVQRRFKGPGPATEFLSLRLRAPRLMEQP